MKPGKSQSSQGFTLLEVLVTIVILAFGLLGIAGLQSKALNAEMESYQRAQALVIAQDMVDRIQVTRINAADYAFSGASVSAYDGETYVGFSATHTCDTGSTAQQDCTDWNNTLTGAAEQIGPTGAKTNIGAMIGAKGCVSYDETTEVAGAGTGTYAVTVVWQGLSSTATPPATVTCGTGTFNNPETNTADETFRRWVVLQFRVANQSII